MTKWRDTFALALRALHNARPHLHYDSSKSGRFSVIKSAANSRLALYLQDHLGTPMDPIMGWPIDRSMGLQKEDQPET